MEQEEKQESNESQSLIDKAMESAKRLEEANKELAELLKKQEEIESRRILGGSSEAGYREPEKSEEEKIREGAKKYFKGTILESIL